MDTSCYFLGVLSFSKLQSFLNNIPEGNPLKSVYLTLKIAFTFRPMWSLNGRVAYPLFPRFHSKCITTNLNVVHVVRDDEN